MLVIKRKRGQSVLIGDDIEIFISEIDNGYVKIGINAPKSCKIIRRELLDEISRENTESIESAESIIKKIKKG